MYLNRLVGTGAMLAVLLLPAQSWAVMAFAFVERPSGLVNCEVSIKGLEGSFEVKGFGGEFRVPVATDPAGGGATGRAEAQPLVLLKQLDKCSPVLFLVTVMGEHLKRVEVRFFDVDKKGALTHIFTIKLQDALISGLKMSGGQGDTPLEEISFNFTKIELIDVRTGTTATWDFAANKF